MSSNSFASLTQLDDENRQIKHQNEKQPEINQSQTKQRQLALNQVTIPLDLPIVTLWAI